MNGFTATAILAFASAMGNLVAGAPVMEANEAGHTRVKLTTTTSTPTATGWPTEIGWPSGLPVPVLTTIHPVPSITSTASQYTFNTSTLRNIKDTTQVSSTVTFRTRSHNHVTTVSGPVNTISELITVEPTPTGEVDAETVIVTQVVPVTTFVAGV